jgi:hypothetical protein
MLNFQVSFQEGTLFIAVKLQTILLLLSAIILRE